MGKIREEMPAVFEGGELEATYNARYLIEALRVMDEESIVLRLTGSLTPGIMAPEGDGNFIYLILPLRV